MFNFHVFFSDFTKEAAMTTYRAYNTTILDHMISHVCMRKHSKKLELKCYIQMKSKVNVQGRHSALAPVIPYKAQRNLKSPNINTRIYLPLKEYK